MRTGGNGGESAVRVDFEGCVRGGFGIQRYRGRGLEECLLPLGADFVERFGFGIGGGSGARVGARRLGERDGGLSPGLGAAFFSVLGRSDIGHRRCFGANNVRRNRG